MTINSGHYPGRGRLPGPLTYSALAIWFVAVLHLGSTGFFYGESTLPLSRLQLTIVAPMAAFWIAFLTFPPFRRYINALDFVFLNLVQTWRVLGGAILVMWGYGLLPGGFAIPMSVLDMSVGVIAVFVVVAIIRRSRGWKTLSWSLNGWGFLDFWVTVSLALFAFHPLPVDPEPAAVQASVLATPLSAFPSFAIPFFSCVHFAAFVRLASLARES